VSTPAGKHTIRVTGIGEITFSHGFAPKVVGSIDKTHARPLKGARELDKY